ncbi:MAG TPA: hypothetical protein VEZ24_07535 [Microvirga sp.]|nr:hypothetical protein [Microvirga sp.]
MATGIYDGTKTGNAYIDPLLSGWKWNGGPVTYGFAQSAAVYGDAINDYYGQYPHYHFEAVSIRSMEAFQGILTGQSTLAGNSMILTPVSGFTNLTFVQTNPATDSTDIRIGMSSLAPFAIGFLPGEYASRGGADGDIWIGNSGAYGAAHKLQNPINGSWAYYTHLWTLGKALGLNSGYMDIPKDKQFKEYTLMTYYNAPDVELPVSVAANGGSSGSYPEFENMTYYNSQTFMMLDIAALQEMYGANYNFRSENNTYTWSPTTGAVYVDGVLNGTVADGLAPNSGEPLPGAGTNKIFQTLWDGNGVDTYDLSNYVTNLKIDLRPGEYSTFSDEQRMYIGRDIHNENFFARGNVYNAMLYHDDVRSLIENAKGGTGGDTLKGNIAKNHLWGNAGMDTFEGGAGDDILDGGSGYDTAVFSGSKANYTITKNADGSFTITDTRTNGEGSDILVSINFAKFSDQVVTLAEPLSLTRQGTAKSEMLTGDMGRDKLYGYGGNDVLNGREGVDYMVGGTGNDTYHVDNAGDRVVETPTGGTADRVVSSTSYTLAAYVENLTGSGSGAIALTGNALNNTVTGNNADNRISGGAGNDLIDSRLGNDILSGGSGKDTFSFGSNNPLDSGNVDTITDFNVIDDIIQLKFFTFPKVSALGTLNRDFFTIGTAAKDRNDYIVYNKVTGVVSYDVDGSGAKAAMDFLKVKAGTALTHADFNVVY